MKKRVKSVSREKSEDDSKSFKANVAVENEKEELDFQFDEDLQVPTGRHNTFTDW